MGLRASLLTVGFSLAALAPMARAAEEFSSLEERMSFTQFKSIGLDKLSPAQLAELNDWLKTHATSGLCTPTSGTVSEASGGEIRASQASESTIAGSFSGWEFGDVLTLDNGQRWRVMEHDALNIATRDHPHVSIERGLVTGWVMTIDGVTQLVHVEPVR